MFLVLALLWKYARLADAEMEGFIVGGSEAKIDDYPHSAFLSIKCDDEDKVGEWICGSSIIHASVLLTAAHCLDGCSRYSIITAAVGNAHRARGYKDVAKTYLIHMKYDKEYIYNDIGMTKLKNPLVLSDKVQIAVLPKKRPSTQTAYVAGWGLIDEVKRKQSNVIKFTKQNLFSKSYCVNLLNDIPEGSICAGNRYNNDDYASEGDSGSALVVADGSGRNKITQIGIVSFKLPDISRSVAVYTDIPYFHDWIQKRLKKILKYGQ